MWVILWRQERKQLQVPNNPSFIGVLSKLEETNTLVCLTHRDDSFIRVIPKNILVTPRAKDNSVVTLAKQSHTLHMKDHHYNLSMTRLLSRQYYMSYHQLATVPCHVTGLLYAIMLAASARICGHLKTRISAFKLGIWVESTVFH